MGYEKRGWSSSIPEVTGTISQFEWCIAHPPEPGKTHADEERCIEITQVLRGGEACGAQIVLTADGFVAKIYDPMYYKFYDGFYLTDKANVTAYADKHYIKEAAAYTELRDTPIYGELTPTYHGSWTMNIPILAEETYSVREVRLIIVGHVPGTSMQALNTEDLTWKERENIMIKVIEADIDLRFVGVRHDDFEPRNIMLSLPEGVNTYDTDDLHVCIIDYAVSFLSKDKGRKGPVPEVHNPLFYWPGRDLWSDWGWLPPWEEAVDWMWTIWGNGGKGGKYLAVLRDPAHPLGEPKRIRTGSEEATA
jgi:hypothetical protein